MAWKDHANFVIFKPGCRCALAACKYAIAISWLAIFMFSILMPFAQTENVFIFTVAESVILQVHSVCSCNAFLPRVIQCGF